MCRGNKEKLLEGTEKEYYTWGGKNEKTGNSWKTWGGVKKEEKVQCQL